MKICSREGVAFSFSFPFFFGGGGGGGWKVPAVVRSVISKERVGSLRMKVEKGDCMQFRERSSPVLHYQL